MNNYLKVLLYLKQFEGDGNFHEIESILTDLPITEKKEILNELAREELIYLDGGIQLGLPLMVFLGDGEPVQVGGASDEFKYIPYRGKLKFKGSKYLKEEMEMTEKGKYNINVEGNSTANVIIGSPGAMINNKAEIIEKVKHIVDTIQSDETISKEEKQEAIQVLNQLQTEISTDNPNSQTIDKVMTIGAKIASIGSLVVALTRLLLGI